MPSFVPDDVEEAPTSDKDKDKKDKKRKVKSNSKPETTGDKKPPAKQQKTLASFFGNAKKPKPASAPPAAPPPEPPTVKPTPPPLLNDKRKAEVMRIVVGQHPRRKKISPSPDQSKSTTMPPTTTTPVRHENDDDEARTVPKHSVPPTATKSIPVDQAILSDDDEPELSAGTTTTMEEKDEPTILQQVDDDDIDGPAAAAVVKKQKQEADGETNTTDSKDDDPHHEEVKTQAAASTRKLSSAKPKRGGKKIDNATPRVVTDDDDIVAVEEIVEEENDRRAGVLSAQTKDDTNDSDDEVVLHDEADTAEQTKSPKKKGSTTGKKPKKNAPAENDINAFKCKKSLSNKPPPPPKPPLSDEDRRKIDQLRATYGPRGEALLDQFRRTLPDDDPVDWTGVDQVDVVVATLIDGSCRPLSSLVVHVTNKLRELHMMNEPNMNVVDKIKLLATRKQAIKTATAGTTPQPDVVVDVFETDNPDWRWEVQMADLVWCKTNRTRRRRLANHYHAIQRLLAGLDAHDVTNLSTLEEKVLKFEREAEKERWGQAAKLAKERKQKEAAERKEQELAAKQLKKLEAEQKKQAKQAAEQQKKDAKARSLAQQGSCLKSFLARSSSSKNKPSAAVVAQQKTVVAAAEGGPKRAVLQNLAPVTTWNADWFRQQLLLTGSDDTTKSPPPLPFAQLTDRARRSRRRRTHMVDVKVQTVVASDEPENPFSSEPRYVEQITVRVKNKFQLFSFHEDVRPAYWGTWSKRSRIVTGRTPFRMDPQYLDYDNDSEAEWEEGDDDMGEELGDNENDMEEDDMEEPEMDGEDDGWLAADDDNGDNAGEALILRYVAPSNGGPSTTKNPSLVVGFSADEAASLLDKLAVIRLTTEPVCYDVEPPNLVSDETETDDVLSDENMAVFVRFVHNNTLSSRDKLIDEFLKLHKTAASSRAQALRVLESMAGKKKDPLRGTLWQVKEEVISSLGLQDLGSEDERQRIDAMKEMATFLHHHTAASKEKLVDEVKARFFESKSRAEVTRLVLSMAEKKKFKSTTRWVIKDETRLELGLDLPDEPIDDHLNASVIAELSPAKNKSSTVTPIPSIPRPSHKAKGSKPVKKGTTLASSNLLDAFVKKGS